MKSKAKKINKKRSNKSSKKRSEKRISAVDKLKLWTSNKKFNKKTVIISAAVVSLLIVVLIVCAAAKSGSIKNPLYLSDAERAYGIDVSSHNGNIDWQVVKDEVDFAFIRVGYRGYSNGEINLDKKAKANMKQANKAEIPIGVYFYSQATTEEEAKEEAKFVLGKIRAYDIALPVVIDFEYPYSDGKHIGRLFEADLDAQQNTDLINAFCKTIEDAGYTPAIYASTYIYESYLNLSDIDKDTIIWVADYNKNITYNGDFDIWQFSEKGKCKGVSSKHVDTNYWYLKR